MEGEGKMLLLVGRCESLSFISRVVLFLSSFLEARVFLRHVRVDRRVGGVRNARREEGIKQTTWEGKKRT